MHRDLTLNILHDVYHATSGGGFITMDELETLHGRSGSQLRPSLEDLKEDGLIVEHEEGFQVSRQGRTYCRSMWA
jgi:predicted transcriptional regulator